MRLFATIISLRGKAILAAAAFAGVSVAFSIGVLWAQVPPNIVGDYVAVVTDAPDIPQTQSRPVAPPNALPARTPKWEVVSVRPCPPAATGGGVRGAGPARSPFSFAADRMTLNCLSARSLIRSA